MPFVEPQDIPGKPWGAETRLVKTDTYELKRLAYRAGHQGGFQLHEARDETFTLHSGGAWVTWIEDGVTRSKSMYPGETFHVPPGTPHKFHAIVDCIVYEASNGEPPASINVAEQYGDEDGQAR